MMLRQSPPSAILRRLALLVLVLVSLGTAPASAHSAANSPASNYVSTLQSIEPSPSGFRARVIEGGSRLEVRWLSGPEVSIPGYEGEPYLRVGPEGAFENQRSPAVAVNRTRDGTDPDPNADSSAAPVWKRLSSGPVVRWHDHRVHWMGGERPQAAQREPDERHLIQTWAVPVTVGSASFTLNGDLVWVPGPSPLGFFALAAVLAAAVALVGLWGARTARSRRPASLLVVALLAVLLVVDALHLVGIAFGVEGSGSAGVGRLFTIGYASLAAWLAGIAGIVLVSRRRDDGLYLVVFSAGLMTVVGGLADLTILSRSSLVFAFSAGLARWCVALTLGLGAGIAIAGVQLTRPAAAASDTALDETDSTTPKISVP